MEWITHFWETLTWSKIIFGLIAIVVSAIISYGIVILVMIKIPADYFSSTYISSLNTQDRHFLSRWSIVILKNIIGILLLIVGVIMLVGPGPGILTILLGLILVDIPGKKPLEAKLIKRPAVLSAINNLRARYQKPPLLLD